MTIDDGKANALTPELFETLGVGLSKSESEARVLVLTGRAGYLSAGFDLKLMGGGPESRQGLVGAGFTFLLQLFRSSIPTVTACTGHAIALGALILLASDVRLGTAGNYLIGLNETEIGLILDPFVVELARYRLLPRAMSGILFAELFSPAEATRVGYLDAVLDAGTVQETARKTASRITKFDERVVSETRRRLHGDVEPRLARLLVEYMNPDRQGS